MSGAPTTAAMLRPVVRLLGTLEHRRSLFVRSTLSMTAFQLATAAAAACSALVAGLVTAGRDPASSPVVLLVVGLAVAIVANAAFTWVESWLSHVLAYRVLADLRLQVHDAIERITPAGMKHRRAGEVAGATMSDVESLEWFYAHTLGAAINAVVAPVVLTGALVVLVGPSGLLVLAGVLVLLAVPWLLAPLQARQGVAVRTELGRLKAMALEGSESLRELLALGLVDHHRDEVLAATRRVQERKRAAAVRAGIESALADVVLAATTLTLLVVLAAQIRSGDLVATALPAAMVLLGAAFAPAAGAFAMVQRLGEIAAAAARVLEVVDAPASVEPSSEPGSEHSVSTAPTPAGGSIHIDGVTFAYPTGPLVLAGVDLTIDPGETVALVGASGAGKSTLAALLVRFWDPTAGRILLDGADLRERPELDLREDVTLVPQSPYLFRGTVRTNLCLGSPDATDAQLWAALDDACLGETVRAMQAGLDAPVGEGGTTLSGGQRQRLAVAQALLRDPSVLVLDESSAHLDATSEHHLAAVLDRVRAGRTTIVIAHRLSTIRRAPRVVLLVDGRVVADGTHDDLLRSSSEYRSLLAQHEPAVRAGSTPSTGRG